ncbi:MAG: hypothetical protein KDC34_04615 [Saprospiraceae bacterium]|nr:hypothetical protein [Saprospiraceae bacterium]
MALSKMNPAKSILFAFFVVFSLGAFSSCQKEGCTDPMSDNYNPDAKKDDGTCTPWRDKFLATYSVEQSCTGEAAKTGTLVASASSKGENMVLFSFDGLNFTGTVATSTSIVIESQTINYQGQDVNITGSGALTESNKSLTLNFTISAGVVNSVCGISGTKL